ncbi:MAG TPA: hypothetical protein DHV59_11555 [Oxalobacteraceae bacterium]|nr:hypothetical protein [Oxalobacteraceae bacterium]
MHVLPADAMRPMRILGRFIERQDVLIPRVFMPLKLRCIGRLDVSPIWFADSHYNLLIYILHWQKQAAFASLRPFERTMKMIGRKNL